MATRRSLAGGAVLALLGTTTTTTAIAAAPINPDAELISLCAQFDALERELQTAVCGAKTRAEDRLADIIADRVRDQQDPLLKRICATPAVTPAGVAALAATLTLWDRQIYFEKDDEGAYTNERLQVALIRAALAGRA